MMQLRSAALAMLVLCFPMPINALAGVSSSAGGAHLRRSAVKSVIGVPPNPPLTTRSEDSGFASEPRNHLMSAINMFRASICAKLKGTHGEHFDTFDACKKFMESVCKPGGDLVMDGDKGEVSTGKGYCDAYFHEQDAEKELKKLEGEEKAKEDIEKLDSLTEEEEVQKGSPQAPAPAPAPAAAAVPVAPDGMVAPAATPEPNVIDDDEKWYYKNGGNWEGRLHMDGDLKLPSQGYWGKLVEHEDQKSVTGDWGSEFGHTSKHRSYSDICKDFPDSSWCKRQGFGPSHHKHSFAYRSATCIVSVMIAVFVGVAF